jgi:hypothetical protein
MTISGRLPAFLNDLDRHGSWTADGNVFLVGAGFSHALAERMPLTTELGERLVAELDRDGLLRSADRALMLHDLEGWLSLLADDQPFLAASETHTNLAILDDALRRLTIQIAHESSLASADEFPTWVQELFEWIVRPRSMTVMTTNYDHLVEAAVLRALGHPGLDPRDLHTVPIHKLDEPEPQTTATRFSRPVNVLKLHGSLSWYWSGPQDHSGDTVCSIPYPLTDLGRRGNHIASSVLPSVFRRVPFVIPPTSGKNAYFTNGFSREVACRHPRGQASDRCRCPSRC